MVLILRLLLARLLARLRVVLLLLLFALDLFALLLLTILMLRRILLVLVVHGVSPCSPRPPGVAFAAEKTPRFPRGLHAPPFSTGHAVAKLQQP